MPEKKFICDSCHKEKPKQPKIQPVPLSKGVNWCQHCWLTYHYGKAWADKCEKEHKEETQCPRI